MNSRFYDSEVGRFVNADTTDILSESANLYDKNLYTYCDNNPVIRKDLSGEYWLIASAMVVGALVNLSTTYIAAQITGQQYTVLDGVVALFAGASNAVPYVGPLINGIITGGYAAIMSYHNGANVLESLFVGGVSGLCAGASLSNLAKLPQTMTNLGICAISDLIFGTGANSISAATYKSVTYNKSNQISNKGKNNNTPIKTSNPRTENRNRYILPSMNNDRRDTGMKIGNPYERFIR